jgi:TolB protein
VQQAAGGGWSPIVAAAAAAVVLLAWATWYVVGHRPMAQDGSPSWSPDGAEVAFASARGGARTITLMNADGTNVRQLPANDRADEGAPAFSPDGQSIAYDADVNGNRDVFVMSATGVRRTRLTNHPARDESPAWSPDGKTIAFVSDRDATPNADIYLMQADGTRVERVTTRGTAGAPQFSPDGAHLAFHADRNIFVIDLAGRRVRQLTTDAAGGDGVFPTWAPGGGRIAFASSRLGRMQIFTMDVEGRDQRSLLRLPAGSAIEPRWSPTGDRIALVQVPDDAPQVDVRAGGARAIYVVEVATGKVTRLSR